VRVHHSDPLSLSQIEVVLGFHNEATMAYNVTAIMGSLNSPMDFSIFVQNFTNQVRDLRMGMKFGIKKAS